MANIVEGNTWEPVIYQLETSDPVMGGVDGIDNLQAKQLAARTQYLKAQQEVHAAAADPHPQYMTQAEADALIEARVGDYSLDSGTANAKVVALNPAIAAYTGNFNGAFKVAVTNTGACTLNAGGGAKALVNGEGAALVAGDLPAGAVVQYQYVLADDKFYVTSLVASLAVTAAEDASGTNDSTRIATTGWIRSAMANIATAAGFAYLWSTNGYIKFPSWLGGWIVQWGVVNNSATIGASTPVTFPIAFPNQCINVYNTASAVTAGTSAAWIDTFTDAGFGSRANIANMTSRWLAIGR